MALVNADYEFIFVDVGKNGRLSDGGVIESTKFYHKLIHGQLHLPNNTDTENNFNFVFLGDEAFSLHENFLKPYPQRDLSYSKRIFNYRLSRARNVSENAFGLIHMKNPENICYVVLAICSLHNFLRKRDTSYTTSTSFDQENLITKELQVGDWRKNAVNMTKLESRNKKVATIAAKTNRDYYTSYFNSDGKVDWQDEMLAKEKA
ncbi:unnamed protein product [Acanthoscelides obtectus]|uniref:DDE Tnp4 domain-containing protein n=1 Tax=Acanthoscelides obtectus TaxID=200917 RepID=A0A9P0KL29_ACAOB|nr:unnamed protein product [Acanthoscelides obtectus]CAK1622107.1 hypothetical protein AOBTE_LOCUS1316 [Acanthoscelides obtectus]